MKTYLIAVRHGEPLSEGYADDALRPLSEKGRREQLETAQTLKNRGYEIDRLLSSPLIRALQSADVIGDLYGKPVAEEPALGPNFDEARLIDQIRAGQTTLMVGHAPTLAEFVNGLVGEFTIASLAKSGFAVVEFEGKVALGSGTFVESYHPQSLGEL